VFFSRIVRHMAIIDGVLKRSKDVLHLLLRAPIDEHRKTSFPWWCDCPPGCCSTPVKSEPRCHCRRLGPIAIAVIAFDDDDGGVPTRDASWGAAIPSRLPQLPQSQHGTFLALICGGGVRRAVVACGGGELGGGVGLFSMLSDGTLRGEMKRYVKNMSGHKFAECWGGRSANLCFYDQHTHNSNRVKNKVKKTRICVFMTKIFVSLRF